MPLGRSAKKRSAAFMKASACPGAPQPEAQAMIFYSPVDFDLKPGQTLKMPTGIRAQMDLGWVLKIYPRSGLGFKYRLQLNNTVGIIDSDYFNSDNEGHIFIKITNDSKEGKTVQVQGGTGFAQGIFLEYGITVDDDATAVRNGGMGSTTGK